MRILYGCLLLAAVGSTAFGQARTTVQSGPWNVGATWSGGVVPTAANSTSITVAHNVNIPSGFTATIDQTTVNQNITITVDAGGILVVADDGTAAIDLALFNNGVNFGFLSVFGQVTGNNGSTFSGTSINNVSFEASATYRHNYTTTEGSLPVADWDPASIALIEGYNTSITATAGGNWSQNFGHFTVNCFLPFTATIDFSGLLTSVAGDLTLTATNGGTASQGQVLFSSGQAPTITIGGDFIASGTSRFYFSSGGATTSISIGGDFRVTSTNNKGFGLATAGTTIANVSGDFFFDGVGARFYLINGAGSATMNLTGDFTLVNGTYPTNGNLVFNGTTQSYSSTSNFTGAVNITIAPSSTLSLGTNVLAGSGTFTLQGTVGLGSLEPTGAIVNSTSLGNIRTPVAQRSYASGSRIIYNGAAAQFMGTGQPSSANLTTEINNASGVSLAGAASIGGNLVLTQGTLSIGSQSLTLAGGISVTSGNISVTNGSTLIANGTGALGNLPFAAGAQTIGNLTINRTAGSVGLNNNDVTIAGVLTLTAGNLTFDGRTLTLNGTHTRTGGLLSASSSSTLVIGGNGALGTAVAFSGSGNTINTLTINRPGTGNVSFTSALNVTTAVNLTNGGLINGGSISLANGAVVTRASGSISTNRFINTAGDTWNVVYTGGGYTTGFELPDPTDNVDLNNITFNGGAITNGQNLTINGTALFSAGTFTCGLRTITMEGSAWTVNGGSFVPSTGTLIFNGNTTLGGSGTISFNIFTVNNGATVTMSTGNVNISSNFTLNASSTFNDNGGTLTFTGTSGQNISANNKTLANLIVNKSGGTLTFTSAARISGTLTISSVTTVVSSGNVTLLSTSDGATGNGSIGPIPTGASITGNVTVQRFMSDEGTINRYISVSANSIPVTQLQDDFSVTGSFTGTSFPCAGCLNNGPSLKWYRESTIGAFEGGYQGYPLASNSEQLVVGRGYLAYMWEASPLNPKVVTMDIVGTVVQGTFDYSSPVDLITRTNSGQPQFDDDDGWNLIGNPYPASITWSNSGAQWSKTDIAPTIYVTDNQAGVFRSWNANTSVGDIPGGRIAAGQAFWVYANTSGATLSVHEPAKAATTGVFFRERPVGTGNLMVSLKHNGITDNSYLVVHPQATMAYDMDYDAIKPRNPVFDIAFIHPSGKSLAMNAISDIAKAGNIPLKVRSTEAGDYTIAFTSTGPLNYTGELYLIDQVQERSIQITNTATYSFSMEAPMDLTERFYISSSPVMFEKKTPFISQGVSVYPNPASSVLMVRAEASVSAEASLVSATGQVMLRQGLERVDEERFAGELNIQALPVGIYIVRVIADGIIVNRKIIKN